MNINYSLIEDLPKLAWLASLDMEGGNLNVFHGSGVERCDEWMVEGVWDGDFGDGGFHRSENFFGSGLRIDGDFVYFVSSTALTERLVYCHYSGKMLVSNSLVFLLAFTGSMLDYKHLYTESWAIMKGIKSYDKGFHVKHPEIECFYQVYHNNIVWRNDEIAFETPSNLREIKSYEQYYILLKDILIRIQENYQSPLRKIPMSSFTTLSSGYDTTAIASLVKDIGVKTCFSSKYGSSKALRWLSRPAAVDDGSKAADVLGLQMIYLESASSVNDDELYFLAPSWGSYGLVFHSMASFIENNCKAAVVFVGHNGDILWDVNVDKKHINDEMMPGDLGGITLSEIRLKSGFVQVSVPYILARNIKAINRISHSDEMRPWRLNNAYDRPIPRRIAEEAGVPRESFGQRNKAVGQYYYYPRNRLLRKEFFQFLKKCYNMRARFVYSYVSLNWMYHVLSKGLQYIRYFRHEGAMKSGMRAGVDDTKLNPMWKDINLYRAMFIWAANTLSKRTAEILKKNHVEDS